VSGGFFVLMATWAGRTISFTDTMEVFIERRVAGDELCDDAGVFAR